jgi:hypothetical protein
MMTHPDLETKIGGERELREECLEKVAGGNTPVVVVTGIVAASALASISISQHAGGW